MADNKLVLASDASGSNKTTYTLLSGRSSTTLVDTNNDQSIGGVKRFSNQIILSGNANLHTVPVPIYYGSGWAVVPYDNAIVAKIVCDDAFASATVAYNSLTGQSKISVTAPLGSKINTIYNSNSDKSGPVGSQVVTVTITNLPTGWVIESSTVSATVTDIGGALVTGTTHTETFSNSANASTATVTIKNPSSNSNTWTATYTLNYTRSFSSTVYYLTLL